MSCSELFNTKAGRCISLKHFREVCAVLCFQEVPSIVLVKLL